MPNAIVLINNRKVDISCIRTRINVNTRFFCIKDIKGRRLLGFQKGQKFRRRLALYAGQMRRHRFSLHETKTVELLAYHGTFEDLILKLIRLLVNRYRVWSMASPGPAANTLILYLVDDPLKISFKINSNGNRLYLIWTRTKDVHMSLVCVSIRKGRHRSALPMR